MVYLVVLDDGRVVCVYVYEGADDPWPWTVAYVISEDQGNSWSDEIIVDTGGWIVDAHAYGGWLNACAKGNDVVVTACDREISGNTLIFRP